MANTLTSSTGGRIQLFRGHRFLFLLVGVILLLVLPGWLAPTPTPGNPASPVGLPTTRGEPHLAASFPTPIKHVLTVILENQPRSAVLSGGPFERYLSKTYASASNYYSVCHPSAPNYLAATSGSSWQCGSDNYNVYNTSNIGDLMDNASLPAWYGFMENMTTPCLTSASGNYAIKHNPFPFYYDIVHGANSRCAKHDLPLTSWNGNVTNGSIPTYAWISPDQNHDGHNTNVSVADTWLKGWMSPLINDSWFNSTVIFVIWDEATGSNPNSGYNGTAGGNTFFAAVSPYAKHGYNSTRNASHYNLLSTTEWLLGLGSTGHNDSTSKFPAMKDLFNFSTSSKLAAPTGLKATARNSTWIGLSWTNPSGGGLKNNTLYSGTTCSGLTTVSSLGVATSTNVTGLKPHTFYCFAVTAWNSTAQSPKSSTATATTPGLPQAPTGLTAGTVTASSIALTWTNPPGSGLLNDTLYRGTTCGTWTNISSLGVATSVTVTGLAMNTTYCFSVSAWNSTGESPPSSSASATTLKAPAAPSGLTIGTVTASSISLTWTNPAGGSLVNDTLYWGHACSGLTNASSLGVATSAKVTGLNPQTSYCFAVTAWNSTGQSPKSSNATATTLGPPGAPRSLTVGTVNATTLKLNWTNPSGGGLLNDTLYRGTNCGSWTNVTSLGVKSSVTVTGLATHSPYCFAVTAWNSSGESPESSTATATTLGLPGAPTALTVGTVNATAVGLTWTNPSGAGLLNDTLYRGTSCGSWTTISSLGVATSVTVSPLTAHTSYCFAVTAWNSTGQSPKSSSATATTLGVPGAPSGLSVGTVNATTIQLNWTNPSGGGLLNDTLYRGTTCGSWTNITSLGVKSSVTATGLLTHTSYCFAVSAWNSTGQSSKSSTVKATTLGVPAAPTGVTIGTLTAKSVALSWTNPAGGGLVNDTLYRGTKCGTWSNTTSLGVATSVNVTGLTTHTWYCFAVSAWNSSGQSPSSSTATATTLGLPGAPSGFTVGTVNATAVELNWTNPPGGGVLNVTLYRGTACGTWTNTTSVGVATSVRVTGLAAHTWYCFALSVWNSTGQSPKSSTAITTTLGLPGTPTSLTISTVTASSITLTWTNPSGGGLLNDTLFRGATCGSWTSISSLGVVESVTVPNLAAHSSYCFAVSAWNSTGQSPPSTTAIATTFGLPGVPTGLTAQTVNATAIGLNWTNPSGGGLLNDTLYRGTTCGTWTTITSVGVTTAVTVTGLTPHTYYCFAVSAWNGTGQSRLSLGATATTFGPPAVPTGLRITAATATTLNLSWGNPPGALVGDTILWGTSCALLTNRENLPGPAISGTVTGLSASTSYCFAVIASNPYGGSPPSSPAMATTASAPATGLTVVNETATGVTLAWTNPTLAPVNTTVYVGFACGKWIAKYSAGPVSTFAVGKLTPNSGYCFVVRTWSRGGGTDSQVLLGSSRPEPPVVLAILAITNNSVELEWAQPTGTISQDSVLWGTSCGAWVGSATFSSTTVYTVTGLRASTRYCFSVEAMNHTLSSGLGNPVNATTRPLTSEGPPGGTVSPSVGSTSSGWLLFAVLLVAPPGAVTAAALGRARSRGRSPAAANVRVRGPGQNDTSSGGSRLRQTTKR